MSRGGVYRPRYFAPSSFAPLSKAAANMTYPETPHAPASDVTDGTWTTDTGGTSLYAAIDETTPSDADYIKSATLNPGQNDTCEVKFASVGSNGGRYFVRYRLRKDPTSTAAASAVVSLVQGTTVKASWTHSGLSTDWTTFDSYLTAAEVASISDYSDLRIRIRAET